MDWQGQIGEDGQQTDPCPKGFSHQKIIPADPSQPCGAGHMLVGEMALLVLPIDKLGSGDRYGLVSKGLNRCGNDQPYRVEEDVNSLIMLKVKRGRLVLNPIHDRIGEVITNGDGQGKMLEGGPWEKNCLFSERAEIRDAKQGAPPLLTKGFDLFGILLLGHVLFCDSGRRPQTLD